MDIIIVIVAMIIVGVIMANVAGAIWKDDRPLGAQGDTVVAIVTCIVVGLLDWYVIPAMGFSDTLKYIGIATNNVAELKAVEAGLADLKTTEIPVRIYTDSSYVHGVLSLGWKARRNLNLVDSVKGLMEKFKDLRRFRSLLTVEEGQDKPLYKIKKHPRLVIHDGVARFRS